LSYTTGASNTSFLASKLMVPNLTDMLVCWAVCQGFESGYIVVGIALVSSSWVSRVVTVFSQSRRRSGQVQGRRAQRYS